MSKRSNKMHGKGTARYTTARPSYPPSLEKGKSFAYYDKEPRQSHPWGEPAQRPIVMEDEGRPKRVYKDGTLAEGVLSPTTIKNSVEIGGIATKAFEIPKGEEDRIKAAELYGLHGQELDDFLAYEPQAEAA